MIVLQNLSQVGYVNFGHGKHGVAVFAPYVIIKLFFVHYDIAVAYKIFHYIVHLSGQLDVLTVNGEHLGLNVEFHILQFIYAVLEQVVGSAQYRIYPGFSFPDIDWSVQVFVRAQFENVSRQLGIVHIAYDNERYVAALSELSDKFDAIHLGQFYIGYDKIIHVGRSSEKRVFAVFADITFAYVFHYGYHLIARFRSAFAN